MAAVCSFIACSLALIYGSQLKTANLLSEKYAWPLRASGVCKAGLPLVNPVLWPEMAPLAVQGRGRHFPLRECNFCRGTVCGAAVVFYQPAACQQSVCPKSRKRCEQ